MQILNAENTFNTGIFQYNNREKMKTRAIEDRTHSILVPFTAILKGKLKIVGPEKSENTFYSCTFHSNNRETVKTARPEKAENTFILVPFIAIIGNQK